MKVPSSIILRQLLALVVAIGVVCPASGADFRSAPPVTGGGVLETKAANAFASGLMLEELRPDQDFTIEGWVYVPAWSRDADAPMYLFFQEGFAEVEISGSVIGGQIRIFFGLATGKPKEFAGPNFVRPWGEFENRWHHFGAVHDTAKREQRLYWNGIITAARERRTDTFGALAPPLDQACVGGALVNVALNVPYYWDEVRVSKSTRYSANFPPPRAAFPTDADTVALWHFDESEGATKFRDASGHGHDLASQGGAVGVGLDAGPAAPPAPRLTMERLPDGTLQLTLSGQPGRNYRIERSAALGSWSALQELKLDLAKGVLPITGPPKTAEFFRAVDFTTDAP